LQESHTPPWQYPKSIIRDGSLQAVLSGELEQTLFPDPPTPLAPPLPGPPPVLELQATHVRWDEQHC
jgi:hypothetical protein